MWQLGHRLVQTKPRSLFKHESLTSPQWPLIWNVVDPCCPSRHMCCPVFVHCRQLMGLTRVCLEGDTHVPLLQRCACKNRVQTWTSQRRQVSGGKHKVAAATAEGSSGCTTTKHSLNLLDQMDIMSLCHRSGQGTVGSECSCVWQRFGGCFLWCSEVRSGDRCPIL